MALINKLFPFAFLLLLASCATVKNVERQRIQHIRREITESSVFSRAFTGFTLLDPASGKILVDINGDHYFTPASNTKIWTLATCLEILGDSVPALKVAHLGNELVFSSTADPTFLHPLFRAWQQNDAISVLKTAPALRYYPRPFPDKRFGPGWAWDDYEYYFQAERSAMPVYGNTLRFTKTEGDSIQVWPAFLRSNFSPVAHPLETEVARNEFENKWLYQQNAPATTLDLPFRTEGLFEQILADTLHRSFAILPPESSPKLTFKTMYSTPLDTVLRLMMYDSDNFIAEQMLLVCAGEKLDTFHQNSIIQYMLDSVLLSLPQKPKWVDGSGLSRYNLMTPKSITQVLLHLWKRQNKERLLSLFPAGGVSGTIKEWYVSPDGKPYVFAKTGGLGGVHCLSGYITCKSGKTLIFSFMHNNFNGSNRQWKQEMQRIFEIIRDW
jgi:D-alanyl-D-alanine carboxypeptidase/D-alanyl-D-alanine-endopeptidase (penicillin-binding protein 4)